ncbi:MAG: SpoIID/LytB domain-containing protein [Coleofasciculus sp. G1-WW12-02]|uniref:SpoIID/LytB domain-containing protein n=1 Tax=Coleofasciculus sp. G1-WW12-02 TaxID=3068483 RepID=UPI00330238BB
MIRLPNNHPILKGSRLWSMVVVSASLVLPLMLAQSFYSGSKPIASSPQPSPEQSPRSEVPPPPNPSPAEVEWRHRLVAQSLSWQYPSTPVPKATPSQSSTAQDTAKTQASGTKPPTANKTAQTQTSAAQSPTANQTPQTQTSASKPPTPLPPKPNAQTQAQTPPPKSSAAASGNSAKAENPPANTASLEMRVAIATGVSSLDVGTSTAGIVVDGNGKTLGKLEANEGVNAQPNGSYLRIGEWKTPGGVWLKPTGGGFVFVNGRWYRGDLLLVSQGDSLLAVNYIELEAYLASVVGSEIYPSWPPAALKAQAIAARSYAIVHYIRPANQLYDLGNTQRWQVYKGIESEWNTTTQAVQQTQGMFLSYKGGVVESLYAASDSIVSNVFGGRGMSQKGAYELAMQGYDYKQILAHYYPGAGLSWIEAQ